MKKCLLIALIAFFSVSLFAQNELQIDDYLAGKYSVKKQSNVQWIPHTNSFSYSIVDTMFVKSSGAVQAGYSITVEQLSKAAGRHFRKMPAYTWIDSNTLVCNYDTSLYVINTKNMRLIKAVNYPYQAENIDRNDRLWSAFTIKNNLYVMDSTGTFFPITHNIEGVSSGAYEVYRKEFGTTKATFWSPTGNYLAYYCNDERKINNYYQLDFTDDFEKLDTIKYPFAGGPNHKVTLAVYNIATKKTVVLETGDSDHYLTNPTWSPDEKFIYIADLARDQAHLSEKQYSVETGTLSKTLFTETNTKYVEPEYPLYFLNNNALQFLYLSRQYGYNQLFLYDLSNAKSKQLTTGTIEIDKIIGIDKTASFVYFSTVDANKPLEKPLYKVSIATANVEQITRTSGTHQGFLSSETNDLLDQFASSNNPSQLDLITAHATTKISQSVNPFISYNFPAIEFSTITAADNKTKLYDCLLKPAHFDTLKKYPIIVYVYGGPHVQLVRNDWLSGFGFIPYYLASKGYVVFVLDSRGSANRGFEFESCTHHQLGVIEMQDQLKGIDYVKTLPFVDSSKVGIFGWSYGGFMVLSLLEKTSGVFKAGIAGSPVTDWKYYEVMYGERYMGKPQDNIFGYVTSSTLNKVKNIKDKLLLINDGLDHITVTNNSAAFLNECIKNNVQIDYFHFPNEDHNFSKNNFSFLMTKICDYFDLYVK